MYKRRTKEELFELNGSFITDKFYLRLYEPLKWVEIHYNELSPEEVWDEVKGELGRVIKMNRPEVMMPNYIELLKKRYSSFYLSDGTIIQRNLNEASLSSFLVVFGIVYRLLPLKESYSEIIKVLVGCIYCHEMFLPLKERVAECENKEMDRNNFVLKSDIELREDDLTPRSLKSELYTDIKPHSWFIAKHEGKEISHQKLKDFFDRHFIRNYKNKYEWVALYLFCKHKHLDEGRGDAKSFIAEMNKDFWYPDRSRMNYGASIQPYLYLAKNIENGEVQWESNGKVSEESIVALQECYERLKSRFTYSNIYK